MPVQPCFLVRNGSHFCGRVGTKSWQPDTALYIEWSRYKSTTIDFRATGTQQDYCCGLVLPQYTAMIVRYSEKLLTAAAAGPIRAQEEPKVEG